MSWAKMKEIVVDFRRTHTQHAPLGNGAAVEKVSSTKLLGVQITEDFNWTKNIALLNSGSISSSG